MDITRREFGGFLRGAAFTLAGTASGLNVAGCRTIKAAEAFSPSDLNSLLPLTSRVAQAGKEGINISAPFGYGRPPIANELADFISSRNGYGYVGANGAASSESQRFLVHAPYESSPPNYNDLEVTSRANAVYRHFRSEVSRTARGSVDHYFSVLMRPSHNRDSIEITTIGVWDREAEILKDAYAESAKHLKGGIRPLTMSVYPTDDVNRNFGTIKNFMLYPNCGYLMIMPTLTSDEIKAYGEVLSGWTEKVTREIKRDPHVELVSLDDPVRDQIRFTSIPGSVDAIITAPHGTSDDQSDLITKRVAQTLKVAGLMVHGHNGFPQEKYENRINVNRPTEGLGGYPRGEFSTKRAESVYASFLQRVKAIAGRGSFPPYIEIHSNGHREAQNSVQVATVGVSGESAKRLKRAYQSAFDENHRKFPGTSIIPLEIEPVDSPIMNAFGAKQIGIFSEVSKGLHIEFPSRKIGKNMPARDIHVLAVTRMIETLIHYK